MGSVSFQSDISFCIGYISGETHRIQKLHSDFAQCDNLKKQLIKQFG